MNFADMHGRCDSFPGNKHQAKIWQAYTVASQCHRCSRFSAHTDCILHMLLLAFPAICCGPGQSGVDRRIDNCVSPCQMPVEDAQTYASDTDNVAA